MAEAQDLQSAMLSAEQAAGTGDFETAEAMLRRVLELQKGALGPAHPDLANTLNNLGVVYERLGKPEEAGRAYHQAFAIARAALGAGHPSVVTSERNLSDFHDARGIPLEQRPAAQARAPGDAVPARAGGLKSSLVVAALVASALIAIALFARSRPSPAPAPAPAAAPQASSPAPPARTPAARPATVPPARPRPSAATTSVVPKVVDARLCRELHTGSEWQCIPIEGAVEQGAVYFYTTLASTADTTVQHRWYRGGRLHQTVTLHIGANPAGFRTYSQLTVAPGRAGDWRVEVRGADGTVLKQQRFTIGR